MTMKLVFLAVLALFLLSWPSASTASVIHHPSSRINSSSTYGWRRPWNQHRLPSPPAHLNHTQVSGNPQRPSNWTVPSLGNSSNSSWPSASGNQSWPWHPVVLPSHPSNGSAAGNSSWPQPPPSNWSIPSLGNSSNWSWPTITVNLTGHGNSSNSSWPSASVNQTLPWHPVILPSHPSNGSAAGNLSWSHPPPSNWSVPAGGNSSNSSWPSASVNQTRSWQPVILPSHPSNGSAAGNGSWHVTHWWSWASNRTQPIAPHNSSTY